MYTLYLECFYEEQRYIFRHREYKTIGEEQHRNVQKGKNNIRNIRYSGRGGTLIASVGKQGRLLNWQMVNDAILPFNVKGIQATNNGLDEGDVD